ncbi:MAG: hypothetical protein BSOLF_0533 [Candidatus Carbobacillus altaicus]|uniref:CobQ/CobB/MinD/ParA nucleotide binding domain-containing protein n=1 Tax=Candidatus Carbonibacillus altaicus TaxID=2163959 RepID=A0A2R6Y0P8_9BACL|nr:MAG: hypothetical protein BSOLF_0533 [Candidatus Carbobacillus altaicus]
MRIIIKNIHLIFAEGPAEALQAALEQEGFTVTRDMNILLFSAAIKTVHADIALIQGDMPGISSTEVLEAVRKIRLTKPEMRLVFIHPTKDPQLLTGLIALGVYDHHIAGEFSLEDLLNWIKTSMTYRDAYVLIESTLTVNEPFLQERSLEKREEVIDEQENVHEKSLEEKEVIVQQKSVKQETKKKKAKTKKVAKTQAKTFLLKDLFQSIAMRLKRNRLKNGFEDEEETYEDLDTFFNTVSKPPEEVPEARLEKRAIKERMGYVVAVYSGTKGSTGKTTLSIALAGYLARKEKNVALVDADESSYGASILLFGDPTITPRKNRILNGATLYPKQAIEGSLRNSSTITIIDFGAVLTPEDIRILEKANLVLVVTLPETATVSIIRRHILKNNIPNARLVINRHVPGEGLPPWDVAKSMNLPLLETIPFDLQSLETGALQKINVIDVRGNKFIEPISRIGDRILIEIPNRRGVII